MSNYNTYSDDTKAAAMAALLAGQSIGQVAREYNIPKGTVSSWKNRGIGVQDATQKKDVGELLLNYLHTNLEALAAQAEMFKNESWLMRQNAADVAVLHGVMTDKAIRLMEAFNAQAED
ncbi:MAG: helix-turn-helix domain-containing protein [Dehalococcoidia bacterium]|jgi:transposase-like protein